LIDISVTGGGKAKKRHILNWNKWRIRIILIEERNPGRLGLYQAGLGNSGALKTKKKKKNEERRLEREWTG